MATAFAKPSTVRAQAARSQRLRRASRSVVRAAASAPLADGEAVKLAKTFGLEGLEEGFFGFRPFPEMWVGRLAMLGFATGLTVELSTGVPILQQIGLDTPNPLLFQLLAGAIGGASAFATGRTLVRLQSGDMDVATFRRYASFFGLNAEAVAAAEAKRRKAEGRDFTAADSMAAIEAAKQASLGAEADAAADAAAPRSFEEDASAAVAEGLAVRLDQPDIEKAFAKGVELNNGRAAMLGFAIAILIEAASGVGIVGQMESYAKLVGLLGPQSGF